MMVCFQKFAIYTCGFFLTALVFIQTASASTQDNEVGDVEYARDMIQGVKIYPIDRQCAMVGGLCVHSRDCLEPTGTKGLCPTSSHLGVECCYELPMRPAPCSEHLGECMDRCAEEIMRPGTDCQNGQVCCVLL